jgi:SAM-dependent methyltransferase
MAGSRPLKLLELGCGEAQIIGAVVDGHGQECSRRESVGVDYLHSSIQRCRRDYPGMTFIEGDFTDPALLAKLGQFDMVLLVNALHEVFSMTYSEELGEVDVPLAKARCADAFARAAERLAPGGYLLLFDGLEPPGDLQRRVRIRFLTIQAREDFDTFVREYHPFRITPHPRPDRFSVELSLRDFTRYIDKSIFLGKHLWPHERFESYQYYNESEFRAAFERAGLEIRELRTLTENYEKWASIVEIETPGEDFNAEHILIVGQKPA